MKLNENSIAATLPWSCTHFGNVSEIESHVPATDLWVTIAEVHSFSVFDAEDIASFIVAAANDYAQNRFLIWSMGIVLEKCLAGANLTPHERRKAAALVKQAKIAV